MFMLEQKLSTKIWWKIKGTIFNTYKVSNPDNNKFIVGKRCLSL